MKGNDCETRISVQKCLCGEGVKGRVMVIRYHVVHILQSSRIARVHVRSLAIPKDYNISAVIISKTTPCSFVTKEYVLPRSMQVLVFYILRSLGCLTRTMGRAMWSNPLHRQKMPDCKDFLCTLRTCPHPDYLEVLFRRRDAYLPSRGDLSEAYTSLN